MTVPEIPAAVPWRNGMVLEPSHFHETDRRAAALSHLAAMAAEPWPWGFANVVVDDVALASAQLNVDCDGILPSGEPFKAQRLTRALPAGEEGDRADFHVQGAEDGTVVLSSGTEAPASETLPVARLVFHGGVWSHLADWSPPAYLLGPEHPMRADMAQQLGALAALCAGFMATLRLPGAEERPAARVIGQVAAALAQGVGVMEALLAAPAVSPARLGVEALRLALGVRAAAGVLEQLEAAWDPADQRGSMRRLLYASETTASGIGLPFRASPFRRNEDGLLVVEGMPLDPLLLAIEAGRPADLIAARSWLEGAAMAAPERIQDAFGRRVAGCRRQAIDRDPRIGVSSGPLLALYQVANDASWRGSSGDLALAATTPPPPNTTFSVFVPDDPQGARSPPRAPGRRTSSFASASWAGGDRSGGPSR